MSYEDEVAGLATAAVTAAGESTAMAGEAEEEKEGGAEEGREGAAAVQQAPGHREAGNGDCGAGAEAVQKHYRHLGRAVPASAAVPVP